jgi:hypothetical protein
MGAVCRSTARVVVGSVVSARDWRRPRPPDAHRLASSLWTYPGSWPSGDRSRACSSVAKPPS